jgi:hypothetical protein
VKGHIKEAPPKVDSAGLRVARSCKTDARAPNILAESERQERGEGGEGLGVRLPTSDTPSRVGTTVCRRVNEPGEESDAYSCIVRSDRGRVIECRHAIQWIVQVWCGNRWRSSSYHRDREALIEHCRLRQMDEVALAELLKLPRWKL